MSKVATELMRALPQSLARTDLSLESIVVVSAFAGPKFFEALRKDLRAKSVYVVLDSGTPDEVLASVTKALGKRRLKRLSVGHCRGLMHAKLYFCEWRARGKVHPLFTLNIGSANASAGGFWRNAEAMAAIRVYPSVDRAIFKYFDAIIDGEALVREPRNTVWAQGARSLGVGLELPGIRLHRPRQTPPFDSWLQRGVLCHRFQPDPSFLSFRVELQQGLPLDNEVAPILRRAGLLEDGGVKSLRRKYVEIRRPPKEGGQIGPWKGQYFIETPLGYWTSQNCFRRGWRKFQPAGSDERRDALRRFASSSERQRRGWVSSFVSSLEAAEAELREQGHDPDEWFGTKLSPGLDLFAEKERCKDRVLADQKKASSDDFRDRWATGYAFPRVPQFRLDVPAWKHFTKGFATTVMLHDQKLQVQNLFTRVCRKIDGFAEAKRSIDDLLAWWRTDTVWDEVLGRWNEELEHRLQ